MAKIFVYQNDSSSNLRGFRFYSKSGEVLLEVGTFNTLPHEILLQEGERVLGIKSRMSGKGKNEYHKDLQFIIGKLVTGYDSTTRVC